MPESVIQVFPAFERSLEELCAQPHPQNGNSKRLLFADGTSPPRAIETHVSAFWSESSLMVFFCGKFSRLRLSLEGPPGRTPRLWEVSDVFEFFVGRDCERTGRYKEFQVAPSGRWLAVDIHLQEGQIITAEPDRASFRGISIIEGDTRVWKSGMEISWAELGGLEGKGTLQGNFYRASGKFHGDELLAWRPTGYGDHCFHRPVRFGTLEIVRS